MLTEKEEIDGIIDIKLAKLQRNADEHWEQLSPEKEELKLG